jgi:hypothetical protein
VILFIAGLIKRGKARGVAVPINVSDKRHEDRDVNGVKM